MGLFDGILGEIAGALGGSQAGQSPQNEMLGTILQSFLGAQAHGQMPAFLAAAMALLQQQGGLEGLAAKMRSQGLGSHVDSWIGTGANAAITPDQIARIFGGGSIQNVAGQFGTSGDSLTNQLAHILPQLVNQLTPQGSAPEGVDQMLAQGLDLLRRTRV